ncbi:MAG: phosphonate C-P lyase system protein PhnG [Cyanobacteria bacterium J06632_3]
MATVTERQHWMKTLAKATPTELAEHVSKLGELPEYRFLRSPEIGLTMVRGRAGGSGNAFNLGEMTLTRCVVQLTELSEQTTGFGYVAGRSQQHAELAAVCDALLQQSQWHDRVQTGVIVPLRERYEEKLRSQQQQTASTQVEFFTMLRGS